VQESIHKNGPNLMLPGIIAQQGNTHSHTTKGNENLKKEGSEAL
jgi:hypothetical protein